MPFLLPRNGVCARPDRVPDPAPGSTKFSMRTNSVMNMVGAKTFRWTSLLAAALLLFVPALASAQTFVQEKSNVFDPNNPNLGTVNVTFTNPATAGNLIVVVVGWSDTTSTVAAVTDDGGNAYQVAAGTTASTCCSQTIYFAKSIKAAQTVKVDFNQVAAAPDVRIREYSGLDATQPLDTSTGAPSSSGSPGATADSGTVTTNNANDLIVGAGTISSFFKLPGGAGFGNVTITPHFSDIIEDKNVSVAGPNNATATAGAAGDWAMQMAAFSTTSVTVVGTPTIVTLTPNSGPDTGGTPLVITGTNFQSGAVVLFDGASAVNCSVKGATEIDCNTPTHGIGNANVTVQNVDGVASAAATFTYTKSTPVVTGVTPGQGITNGGNLVTISGSSFVGPSVKVTFGGVPASNVTLQNSTTIQAAPPAHAVGAVDVVVTNGDGGVSPPLAGGYTYTLGAGPVNFIQGAGSGASSGTHGSWNASFPNPQTAGDTTIVIVGWSNSGDVSSVSDDGGNTYTRALSTSTNVAGNISQTIYYAKNIKSSTTITANFTSAVGAPDVRVLEYSGLDQSNPLDTSLAAAAAAFGNGTVADSGPVSTTFSNNLVVAGAMVGQTVVSAGNNFVLATVTNDGNASEHQLNSAPVGGVHAVANVKPASAWLIQAVTFHANAALTPPNFTLGASPASSSVNPGSSATYTLSLTPQNGFNSAVNLTCSGPSGVGIACSLSPSSITPGTPSTLTVTTTGPTAALVAPAKNRSLLPLYAIWLPLPGMALAGIGYASRKRKLAIGMTLFLALGLALLLAGCGGGGSSSGGGGGGGGGGGTAAGTYTITVTGTSGNLSHNAQVTLTVK